MAGVQKVIPRTECAGKSTRPCSRVLPAPKTPECRQDKAQGPLAAARVAMDKAAPIERWPRLPVSFLRDALRVRNRFFPCIVRCAEFRQAACRGCRAAFFESCRARIHPGWKRLSDGATNFLESSRPAVYA